MLTLTTIARGRKKIGRLAFIALSVAALAACGSNGRAALPSEPAATDAPTTAPAATAAPATDVTVAAESTEATPPATAPASTDAVPETVVPDPTVPDTVAPVTAPPTTAAPVSTDPIVAVDANGDAVIVASDGSLTVLHDGTDPDDPLPEEGPVVKVAGVAVTSDLGVRVVGTCCEPSPGSLIITTSADPAAETVGFGHAPAISPDQMRLAAVTLDAITVSNLDLTGSAYVAIETAGATVLGVEWVDDSHVVTLVSSPAEAALYRYEVTAGGLVATDVVSVPVASSLAGVSDGIVYTRGESATLAAYAADTLAAQPAADIVLPAVPLSASVHDGVLRWIDQDRTLHVGDSVVPGQYVWVG